MLGRQEFGIPKGIFCWVFLFESYFASLRFTTMGEEGEKVGEADPSLWFETFRYP